MPEYTIQDAETGRELVVEGAVPPTPEDMEELFAESYRREGITPTPSDLVAPPPILPPVEEVVPEAVAEIPLEEDPIDPEEELGILGTFTGGASRGFDRLGSTFTDIIPAIAGSAVGNEEYALEQLAEAEEKRRVSELENPTQFESYKEVEGVGDFSRFVSQVVGEQIGNIGLVVGSGLAAMGAAATAPVSIPAGAALIGGTALGSYALNAPEVFENIYQETGETAPGVALLFGAGAAALDSVLPYGIAKTVSPQFKSGIVKTLLERSGMSAGALRSGTAGLFAGLGVEGLTEGGQEAISIAAERFVDDNPEAFGSREWDRIMESVVQGAIAGGVFGGVGGGIQGVRESNDAKVIQARLDKEAEIAKNIDEAGSEIDPLTGDAITPSESGGRLTPEQERNLEAAMAADFDQAETPVAKTQEAETEKRLIELGYSWNAQKNQWEKVTDSASAQEETSLEDVVEEETTSEDAPTTDTVIYSDGEVNWSFTVTDNGDGTYSIVSRNDTTGEHGELIPTGLDSNSVQASSVSEALDIFVNERLEGVKASRQRNIDRLARVKKERPELLPELEAAIEMQDRLIKILEGTVAPEAARVTDMELEQREPADTPSEEVVEEAAPPPRETFYHITTVDNVPAIEQTGLRARTEEGGTYTTLEGETPQQVYAFSDKGEADRWASKMSYDLNLPIENLKIVSFESEVGNVQKDMNTEMQLKYPSAIISNTDIPPSNIVEIAVPGKAPLAADWGSIPVKTLFDDAGNVLEPPTDTGVVVEGEVVSEVTELEAPIAPGTKRSTNVGDGTTQPDNAFSNFPNMRKALDYIKKNTSDKFHRNLANRLAPVMGNTQLVVVTDPDAQIANSQSRNLFNANGTQAVYDEVADTIYVNPETGMNEEVILHEAWHKGTAAKVAIYENSDPNNAGLTAKEVVSLDKIKSLMEAANKNVTARERAGTSTQAERDLADNGAFTNLYEFIAYGRTNGAMQRLINGMPSTDGKTTLFAQFVDLLRQLFNIPASQKNAFMELVKESDSLLLPTSTPGNAGQILANKKVSDKKEFRVNKLLAAIRNATGGARGTLSNMGKLMKETRDGVKSIDTLRESFRRMSDAAVVAIAKVLTSTDLTRWMGDAVNAREINRVVQDFNKEIQIEIAKIHTRIQGWVEFTKKFPAQAKELAEIMHSSSILNIDLAQYATAKEAIANDEVLWGNNKQGPDEIIGKYQKLQDPEISDRAKDDIQEEIQERIDEIEKIYGQWDRVGKVDNKKAHEIYKMARDAYRETFLKGQTRLLEYVNKTTTNPEMRERLIAMIQARYQQANQKKVYFPLMRYGKFWISVGKGADQAFFMRKSAKERDALLENIAGQLGRTSEELIRDGEISVGNELKEKQATFMGATTELKEIFTLIDGMQDTSQEEISQIKDNIYQLYLRSLPPEQMRRRFVRRKNKLGYSEDALRNFINSQQSSAKQLARFKYNTELDLAIQAAEQSLKGMTPKEGFNKYAALLNELSTRAKAELNPVVVEGFDFGKFASLGNQVAFVYMLTAPKSALIQFTQVPIVGIPTLIAKGYGKRNVLRVLGGYLAVINRFGIGESLSVINSKYIDEHRNSAQLKAAYQTAVDLGVTNVTYSADLSARKKSDTDKFDSTPAKTWRGFVDMMGFLFHHSERLSREIIFMATVELELDRLNANKPNLTDDARLSQATQTAVETTYEILFNYTLYEKPPLMKHPVGKIATQFLTYPLQMTSFLIRNFFGTVWPTIPKAERKAAATKLFGTIGMTTLFAGAVGVPGYTAIMGMAEGVREALRPDMDDEDADIWYDEWEGNALGLRSLDVWFREWWIPTMFGPNSDIATVLGLAPETAQGLARGIEMGPISAITDKNIGSSVSLDHLWFQDRVPSDDMKSAFQYFLFDTFGGPLGAMGSQIADGIQDMNEGNFDRGWEKFAPAFFRGPLKAMRLREEGSLTSGQRAQILDAEWYTTGKLLGQALNFQPTTEAEISKANFLAKRVVVEVLRERTKVLNQINMAYAKDMENSTPSTQANIDEALDAVDEYNYRNGFYPIDGDTISQSLTGRATTRAGADQGLIVPQRDLSPLASDLVRSSRVN